MTPSPFWTRWLARVAPPLERERLLAELRTLHRDRVRRWGGHRADAVYRREVLRFTLHALARGMPNGRQIAFTSARGGDRDVWMMEADGRKPTNLTGSPGKDFAPAWSARGTRSSLAELSAHPRATDHEPFAASQRGR